MQNRTAYEFSHSLDPQRKSTTDCYKVVQSHDVNKIKATFPFEIEPYIWDRCRSISLLFLLSSSAHLSYCIPYE